MRFTLPIVFILVGLVWYSLRPIPALAELKKFQEFPTTTGTVEEIKIVGFSGGSGKSYLEGRFSYKVDQREYTSTTPTVYGGYHGRPQNLYQELKRIQNKENKATVYYNPEFPREAYLSIKTSGFQYFMDFIFGGFFIVLGIWMIVATKLQERGLNQPEQDNPITRQ